MKLYPLFLVALHSSAVFSSPFKVPYGRYTPRQATASWKPCFGPNLECTGLPVPLDYADPSAGAALLAIIRYKATGSRLGSLFLNPGGPGASGVKFIESFGRGFSELFGGQYDIIGWDPRGVNNSIPAINCFSAEVTENQMLSMIQNIRIEAGRSFTPRDAEALYSQVNYIDETLSTMYRACVASEGDNLRYVGTVANARDLISMADAIDGPGSPVNYWGMSAGTMIGTYFLNMFPNRAGKIILDSVKSPDAYSAKPPHLAIANTLTDAENTFDGFCFWCSRTTNLCRIGQGRNAAEIKDQIFNILDVVYAFYPVGYSYSTEDIRTALYSYMHDPSTWAELAEQLLLLVQDLVNFGQSIGITSKFKRDTFKGNFVPHLPTSIKPAPYENLPFLIKAKANLRNTLPLSRRSSSINPWVHIAIWCGDTVNPDSTTTKNVLDEIVRLSQISPLFGPIADWTEYYCHRWGSRAVERYSGPWYTTPANRVLVIGNKFDPATPLVNAQTMVQQLGSFAVLVTLNTFGHTSLITPSRCVLSIIQSYLLTNQLPATNVECSLD
ncbi:hypothetical protein FRC02_004318 [Tulasnella sp. 418]|nr:hypothetical protein FRC02_004318 [Tulasnella sp. 418]